LQIRQGKVWAKGHVKAPSPKFGKHLATIKYRISIPRLFIAHVYIDESRDAWSSGQTPFVGVKALIDRFYADMHQREQEMLVPGLTAGSSRIIRRKPFDAAEVVMKGMDLRVLLAVFDDPLKESVPMDATSQSSNYRAPREMPIMNNNSVWVDIDDFVETDWAPPSVDTVHLLPAATCPQFTYFKRNQEPSRVNRNSNIHGSKFGDEDTHTCFMGKEACTFNLYVLR
jgi:hypothetical protein